MKKVWSCLLVVTMAFALAACGKDSEKTSGGDVSVTKGGKGVAIEDVTVDNWQQVVKDNFGLTLTLPEGWTVTKTVSLVGVHVYFGCNADEAEVVSFLEGVFSELKRIATGGITGHYDDAPYNSIAEARAGTFPVDAFNLPVNADGSKKIHFSFGKETAYDAETGKSYIEDTMALAFACARPFRLRHRKAYRGSSQREYRSVRAAGNGKSRRECRRV